MFPRIRQSKKNELQRTEGGGTKRTVDSHGNRTTWPSEGFIPIQSGADKRTNMKPSTETFPQIQVAAPPYNDHCLYIRFQYQWVIPTHKQLSNVIHQKNNISGLNMYSTMSHTKIVFFMWFWPASSLICGNKMPTRCNRGFYCRSYSLLNIGKVI